MILKDLKKEVKQKKWKRVNRRSRKWKVRGRERR